MRIAAVLSGICSAAAASATAAASARCSSGGARPEGCGPAVGLFVHGLADQGVEQAKDAGLQPGGGAACGDEFVRGFLVQHAGRLPGPHQGQQVLHRPGPGRQHLLPRRRRERTAASGPRVFLQRGVMSGQHVERDRGLRRVEGNALGIHGLALLPRVLVPRRTARERIRRPQTKHGNSRRANPRLRAGRARRAGLSATETARGLRAFCLLR